MTTFLRVFLKNQPFLLLIALYICLKDKEAEVNKKISKFDWSKTFTKVVQNPIDMLKIVKKPSCLVYYDKFKNGVNYILLVIYPAQIIGSIFRSHRDFNSQTASTIYLIFGFIMILFISFFLYYTIRLKCTLTKSFSNPSASNIDLIKNTNKKPMQKHLSEVTKNDIMIFLSESEKNKSFKKIIKFILEPEKISLKENNSQESNIDNEDEKLAMAYHEEDSEYSKHFYDSNKDDVKLNIQDVNNDRASESVSKRKPKRSSIRSQTLINLKKKKNSEYFVTDNDMKVLNKIFCLSIFIVGISIIVIVLGIVLSYSLILEKPTGTVVLIIFTFIFEITCIFAIIFLFMGSINNTEYGNLKVIGEIESYIKENNNKSLVFSSLNIAHSQVYNRLKSFLNFNENQNIHDNTNFKNNEKEKEITTGKKLFSNTNKNYVISHQMLNSAEPFNEDCNN